MFRFTIRDLLWLILMVGLACTWGIDRVRLIASQKQAVAAQAKVDADYKEALTALVELYDALGRRGFTTAQVNGKKVEVVGPLNR